MSKKEKPSTQEKKNLNIKQALEDLLDLAVGLSLIAGTYALWKLPAITTMIGVVEIFKVAAAVQIFLVIWMFISGKRYRNK